MSDVRRERILVTVKTYPPLSEKYGETVCTAGVREDGSWIRLYPVPFRRLTEVEQYHKYDWLECRVRTQSSDRRPESFRPVDTAELKRVDHLDTSDLGRERRSDWAQEMVFQILVHRDNLRLPTVITSKDDFSQGAGAISSRVMDPAIGSVIPLQAPDYRTRGGRRE